jgi:magnesium transporter
MASEMKREAANPEESQGEKLFARRTPPPGARPGTLVIAKDALPTRIRMMRYTRDEHSEKSIEHAREIAPLLDSGAVTWVEVEGLGNEEKLREVAEVFGLHALALEDAVNVGHRPKAELLDKHQMYVTRMVLEREHHAVHSEQVTIFFNLDWVLSFQERYRDVLGPVRERIRLQQGTMRRMRADYLAYAIIDAIIDGYYPVIERVGDEIERLEGRVVRHARAHDLERIHALRRDLVIVRRGIWPQRDAINALLRGDNPFVTKPVEHYLRDCYDHCVQIGDVLETYRELVGGLVNTHLSTIANRTNEVMKVLTILSAIFIPLTFVVGIYGMNFDHMPELRWRWGYPIVLALMAAGSGLMLVFFRRKGWLGRNDRP